jgi:hypothetical protein
MELIQFDNLASDGMFSRQASRLWRSDALGEELSGTAK